MKIILFSRQGVVHTAGDLHQMFDAIARFGFDYAVNEEFAPQIERLTGISIDVFELIAAGKLECQPRSMLEVTGDFGDGISTRYAVNEVVIQRQGAGMISVETYVNDQMVATYHGDGLIVSTPTGSTAYSLSVGGPVVAPQCACLVLSPVAPHNLTMRPVVIPSSSDVRLKVHARHAEISIATDNETCPIPEGAEFKVRLASRRFFLAVPHNISFYDTLRKKMMWGVDIRS